MTFNLIFLLFVIINVSNQLNLPPRAQQISLKNFNPYGDGKRLDNFAFQQAFIFTKAKPNTTLIIPKGIYLISPLNLTSHTTIYLESGAILKATKDIGLFPLIEPLPSYGQGRDHEGGRFSPIIGGFNIVDIVITGQNGTIDGQGSVWWDMHRNKTEIYTRGSLIEFVNCTDVYIDTVFLINSPFWTVHPWNSKNVYIDHLTVSNPKDSPNTDGIDPDSVDNMLIQNSFISCGDDGVAIKSGWDCFGLDFNVPAQNIVIRNLTVFYGHAGVGIGSEMSGGVKNISVTNCTFIETNSGGIRLKSAKGRGSYINEVVFANIKIQNKVDPIISIEEDYGGNNPSCKNFNISDHIPKISDIYMIDITGSSTKQPALIFSGLQEQKLSNINLQNCKFDLPSNETSKEYQCADISGFYVNVTPIPCDSFKQKSIQYNEKFLNVLE